jgi:hypothetical protein
MATPPHLHEIACKITATEKAKNAQKARVRVLAASRRVKRLSPLYVRPHFMKLFKSSVLQGEVYPNISR